MPVRLGPKFPKESSWITTGERTRLACWFVRPRANELIVLRGSFNSRSRPSILRLRNAFAGIDIDHASRKLNLREVVTSHMPVAAKAAS